MRNTAAKKLDSSEGASVAKDEDKNLQTTTKNDTEKEEVKSGEEDDLIPTITLDDDEDELDDNLILNISIHKSILNYKTESVKDME